MIISSQTWFTTYQWRQWHDKSENNYEHHDELIITKMNCDLWEAGLCGTYHYTLNQQLQHCFNVELGGITLNEHDFHVVCPLGGTFDWQFVWDEVTAEPVANDICWQQATISWSSTYHPQAIITFLPMPATHHAGPSCNYYSPWLECEMTLWDGSR